MAPTPTEQLSYFEVQNEIEKMETEFNERLVTLLNSCNKEVGIRVMDTVFKREERASAFPLQIDAVDWSVIYPNGIPDGARHLNSFNIFGGGYPNSETVTKVENA